jgi:hypothetical protein
LRCRAVSRVKKISLSSSIFLKKGVDALF